jgi:hypothetical protein
MDHEFPDLNLEIVLVDLRNRLPDPHVPVLIYVNGRKWPFAAWVDEDGGWETNDLSFEFNDKEITHWASFPAISNND